jgi:hypothetical protein
MVSQATKPSPTNGPTVPSQAIRTASRRRLCIRPTAVSTPEGPLWAPPAKKPGAVGPPTALRRGAEGNPSGHFGALTGQIGPKATPRQTDRESRPKRSIASPPCQPTHQSTANRRPARRPARRKLESCRPLSTRRLNWPHRRHHKQSMLARGLWSSVSARSFHGSPRSCRAFAPATRSTLGLWRKSRPKARRGG